MDIQRIYTKLRCDFGRQPLYSERGPELCDSIVPDTIIQRQFMLRNPVNQITQNTQPYSDHTINTVRAEMTRTGINHSEGGWPKDVNCTDIEQTTRYRRKVEKDEDYQHCVMTMTPAMEYYVLQNQAIDMYESYYHNMEPQPPIEPSTCRVVNVYQEPEVKRRPVSSMSWSPDGIHFSTSHANLNFYHKPIGSLTAYIWTIDSAAGPVSTLEPRAALIDLQYNPRDENIFGGGQVDGLVVIFDSRSSHRHPQIISSAFTSHREMVRQVCFINSKSGTELFSGSSDGTLKWWDMRNMEEPFDEIIIDPVKLNTDKPNMVLAMGVCVIEYESTIPTRYMVGTENGYVIGGNRKGKTAMEKLPAKFEAHNGVIKSLERNPQFLKNFLTVGDWTLKIWSEDCRESCIMITPEQRHRLTRATWSPTRVSLITSVLYNGQFAVWDLLQKQHEPIFTQQVCEEPLLCIKAHDGGHHVACGSSNGNIFLIELSAFLTQSYRHDKQMMAAIFDRESKRERIIEARIREIRLKQRQEAEPTSPKGSAMTIDMSIGDRDLIEATSDYMAQIKKELASM